MLLLPVLTPKLTSIHTAVPGVKPVAIPPGETAVRAPETADHGVSELPDVVPVNAAPLAGAVPVP